MAGFNGLIMACYGGGHKNVVKLLLENADNLNIDLNARTRAGWTALMYACASGNPDIVKLFLDYSGPIEIDVNARTPRRYNGQTAYKIASRDGNTAVLNLLQEYSKLKNIDMSES